MSAKSLLLLLLTLTFATCHAFVRRQNDTCLSSTSGRTDFRVDVVSLRNLTGHWSYKIGLLKFGKNLFGLKFDHWTIDVQECRDKVESVLNITLTNLASSGIVNKAGPVNYELIPDLGYYKVHLEIETWNRAKEICEEEGAHLVVYETEKKALALNEFLKKYPKPTGSLNNECLWIGIYQLKAAGNPWYTYSGKLFVYSTVKWNANQLSAANAAGLLYRLDNAKIWWSSPGGKAAFLCELEL